MQYNLGLKDNEKTRVFMLEIHYIHMAIDNGTGTVAMY